MDFPFPFQLLLVPSPARRETAIPKSTPTGLPLVLLSDPGKPPQFQLPAYRSGQVRPTTPPLFRLTHEMPETGVQQFQFSG